jgi:hypothetical protein
LTDAGGNSLLGVAANGSISTVAVFPKFAGAVANFSTAPVLGEVLRIEP